MESWEIKLFPPIIKIIKPEIGLDSRALTATKSQIETRVDALTIFIIRNFMFGSGLGYKIIF